MTYTDRELRAFSSVAYMDLNERYKYLMNSTQRTDIPLSELLTAKQRKEMIEKNKVTLEELNTWKISAIHDSNSKNGFYGCVITTGNGNAAMAFRGSEGIGKFKNLKDWHNDLSGLNNTLTHQQLETENFLSDPHVQAALKDCDSVASTGHSLGGNLAEHAVIVSSKFGLDGKITQCVSLDGQGFSDQYMQKYESQIRTMNQKLGKNWVHYECSAVGNLLTSPTKNVVSLSTGVSGFLDFSRHNRYSWNVNKDGSFDRGYVFDSDFSPVSKGIGYLSKGLDKYLSIMKTVNPASSYALTGTIFVGTWALLHLAPAISWAVDKTEGLFGKKGEKGNTGMLTGDCEPFIIDISAYRSLASANRNIPGNLRGLAAKLRAKRSAPKFNAPPVINELLNGVVSAIFAVIHAIQELFDRSAQSAALLEEAADTVESALEYLTETADLMETVENEAVRLVESWAQNSEGLLK